MKNNKYFAKQWIGMLAFIVPITVMMAIGLLKGYQNAREITIVIGFALAFMFCIRSIASNRLSRLLRNASPEKLIKYHKRTILKHKDVKDVDAYLVSNNALVYCYYGYFEKASGLMQSIDWGKRGAFIQALALTQEGLECCLTKNNIQKGLNFFIAAKEMAESSDLVSGSPKTKKKTMELFNTYVVIGELQAGNHQERFIHILETTFGTTKVYSKLLIAWCLVGVYERNGQIEYAQNMKAYLEKAAPYCRPLHEPFFA